MNALRSTAFATLRNATFAAPARTFTTTRVAANKVVQIGSASAFESVLTSGKPVLVDFFATWCGPCRMLAPTLDKIAKDKADALAVVKVDCDELQELAAKHSVSALPTVVLFKDGKEVDRFMGVRDLKFVENFVVPHTQK
ncbi:thioredoxin [Allomyces macrogynus ATCC 38327]|uniref:Thioredoxin n=1 Tax=Allomyces macrogynus (strain ATCC 38327) TaxID=578462 RepID=A0A0L0SYP0_ALLM3|nr:thioredoxin [Allomyces macrogynus ATCC 38327]|eukprot:KNE67505.1 thioredoxin [Allomyces macrogynus ATCC 38327]